MSATGDSGDKPADRGPDVEEPVCALAPQGLLAELTHRCPFQCPYCSNPLELERTSSELATEDWLSVFDQAAEMGVLQVHLSGGEPSARRDLEQIVERCAKLGLYSNLITAGAPLTRERLGRLAELGLDHVQVSIDDIEPGNADIIGGLKGGHQKKLDAAHWTRELGLPLTINAPLHRRNIHNLEGMIELAAELGACRFEAAHVQYYGWAYLNRAALMPTYEQALWSAEVVDRAREQMKGVLVIDAVVPDYYAKRPKPCMGGWGSGVMNVTPTGKVLPCHAAETIPGLVFDNVRERPLRDIWLNGDAFNAFRGTGWMKEPCRSCAFREIDFGGCRCQAMAVTGDPAATDPACEFSPHHETFTAAARDEAGKPPPDLVYRRIGAQTRREKTQAES
ncbi:MAG: pyrroloquinoline quinone biosynthesis protein PqqE [Dichotomicrobium sp.]